MGVALGGPQGGMPEHLLDLTQVRSPVQHLGGGRMAQGMWGYVWHLGPVGRLMDHLTHLTLADPASAGTQEEGLGIIPGSQG